VGALAAAGSSTGTVTLTVPSSKAPNTYRVLACADDTNVVKEVNEPNNCAVAPARGQLGRRSEEGALISRP
jgi:hypothetical protein